MNLNTQTMVLRFLLSLENYSLEFPQWVVYDATPFMLPLDTHTDLDILCYPNFFP